MSVLVSDFLGWSVNTLFLSVVLYAIYFLLDKTDLNSTGKYLFLKITFLTLPIQSFVFHKIFKIKFFSDYIEPVKMPHADYFVYMEKLPEVKIETINFSWLGLLGVLLFFSYLSIVLFGFLKMIHSYYSLSKVKRVAKPTLLESGQQVYVHSCSLFPAAFGFLSPIILIPQALVKNLSKEKLNILVLHENEHIRKFDPLFNAFRLIVLNILFFSPFVRKLSHAFEQEMELSVDEALIQIQGVDSKFYGHFLVDLCSQDLSSNSFACNIGPKLFLERRIIGMRSISKKKRSFKLFYTPLIVFSLVGLYLPALGFSDKAQVEVPDFEYDGSLQVHCSESECSRDFERTFQSALAGDSHAQARIGEMFQLNIGVKANHTEAMQWLLKASKQGHSRAAYRIGNLHLLGSGVVKDSYKACEWYLLAAERGSSYGKINAATCYLHGVGGFNKSEEKANYWLNLAKEDKKVGAQVALINKMKKRVTFMMQHFDDF